MDFDDRARLDPSQVQDSRGRPSGSPAGAAWAAPTARAWSDAAASARASAQRPVRPARAGGHRCAAVWAPAVRPRRVGHRRGRRQRRVRTRCQTDADRDADCRIVRVVDDLQTYRSSAFPGSYDEADIRLFTGQTQTACGAATSAVGPFYCPADDTAYLDLGFMGALRTTYGGPFAEAYVLAHEFGHHLQDLDGTSFQVQAAGPESPSVRLELQADCYAGVWAGSADDRGFRTVTDADVRDGLSAAAAVGDDRIQESATGRVDPESFSHGTSDQRQTWFRTGFSGGSCDTFAGPSDRSSCIPWPGGGTAGKTIGRGAVHGASVVVLCTAAARGGLHTCTVRQIMGPGQSRLPPSAPDRRTRRLLRSYE